MTCAESILNPGTEVVWARHSGGFSVRSTPFENGRYEITRKELTPQNAGKDRDRRAEIGVAN